MGAVSVECRFSTGHRHCRRKKNSEMGFAIVVLRKYRLGQRVSSLADLRRTAYVEGHIDLHKVGGVRQCLQTPFLIVDFITCVFSAKAAFRTGDNDDPQTLSFLIVCVDFRRVREKLKIKTNWRDFQIVKTVRFLLAHTHASLVRQSNCFCRSSNVAEISV